LRQHKLCPLRSLLLIAALSLVAVCSPAYAQSKVVYLTTGERLKGDITARDEQFLTLKMEGAVATIPLTIVTKIVDMIEERKLSILLVESEDMADFLRDRILSGEAFEDIARKYSRHPSAPGGGNIGFVRKEELEKPLSDAAFALKPGEISKPVAGLFGAYLVRMADKRMVEPSEKEPEKVEVIKKETGRAAITVSVSKFKDNSPQPREERLADSLARRFADDLTSFGFSVTREEKETAQTTEPPQSPKSTYIIGGEAGEKDGIFALSITVTHTASNKTVFSTAITANSKEDYDSSISKLMEEIAGGLDKGFPQTGEPPKEPEKKEPTSEKQSEQPKAPEPPEKPEK
jgi:hypothetical protein